MILLKIKRAADLDRSQRQMKALHKAAIIMKIGLLHKEKIQVQQPLYG